ncbi:MAG TPA: hypothetical protein VF669_05865 [Tepidisphaeraceae bacterium]
MPILRQNDYAKAIKCRWCGEMLNAKPVAQRAAIHAQPPPLPQPAYAPSHGTLLDEVARANVARQAPAQKKAQAQPSATAAGCVGAVVILAVVIGFVVWLFSDGADTSTLPISNTSFVDFDSKFCVHSRLTSVQKDREIENLKGQWVRWEGIVSYVSDDSVGIKHKTTTATYDVLLGVLKNERPALTSLNEGDLLTYEGTITDYGTILPHGLKDGHIVSHSPMSPGDRLIFLAKNETAVMERIGGSSSD